MPNETPRSMSIFRINEKMTGPAAIIASTIFLCLAAIYFSPAQIPHKIAFPLALLTVSGLWLCPIPIVLAMAFSTAGDYFGSCGNFLAQMGCFALTHVMLITFFIRRYFKKVEPDFKLTDKAKGFLAIIILCTGLIIFAAFTQVLPGAPHGIIRTGAGLYTCIICTMLIFAMLQRSSLYALGALLFVMSDFILAWNRFVEPVDNATWFIMVPYYLGQWLLYIRSTSFRAGPEMRLMRF